MPNRTVVPILKSSRTTYFDSLTGITESESGKSSEALKIMGKPELHEKWNPKGIEKGVLTKRGIMRIVSLLRRTGNQNNDLEAISVSKQWSSADLKKEDALELEKDTRELVFARMITKPKSLKQKMGGNLKEKRQYQRSH